MNSHSSRSPITRIALILVGIAVLVFLVSRILPSVRGPYLSEVNIEEEQLLDTHAVTIQGTAQNAETVSINTVVVPLAEDGSFTHPLALNPGLNTITITVSNGFEDTRSYIYEVYTPALDEFYVPLYNEAVDTDKEVDEPLPEPSDEQTPVISNE